MTPASPAPLLLALGTALLGACAPFAPARPAPEAIEVPAAWAGAAPYGAGGRAGLAQWWRRFDDAILDTLVDDALSRNLAIASAQAALRQARALRDVAAAALWPRLSGQASAQHGTSGGDSTGNTFQAGLNANWVPDVFGANRSALEAAAATAGASEASVGDTEVATVAELGLDYILLRSAQARLAIATINLASQEETLQITRWRRDAGLITELEAEQARAAAAQTRAQLPALATSIEQSRHAIAVLTGRPPAALAVLLAASAPVPQPGVVLALGIPADTLRQRADVRAAERRVVAAGARIRQADAARMPAFSLAASLGYSALTLATLTNAASVLSSVIAGMTLPIIDGGALRAQVRVQEAAFDQAHLAYRTVVLTALKDVEDALVALDGDRRRLGELRTAADAATIASQLARQRFAGGLVDFQVVLETQRTQYGTQDNVASAYADVGADHVRLFKALGGGWNDSAVAGTTPPAPPANTPAALRNAPP
jgi:NodT family efflux transporter outer membrane factor (OMF) lipoprotein